MRPAERPFTRKTTSSKPKDFEVTAAGFDASADASDGHVFWLTAASHEMVKEAIRDTSATFCGEVDAIGADGSHLRGQPRDGLAKARQG